MAPANDRKPTGKPVRGRPELGAEAVVPLDALAVVCAVVVEDDDEPLELHIALPGGRVALVHDFLLDLRGAERVFLEMCALWPEAPLFTAVYDEEGTEGRFADREVNASFLQRLRPSARTFRALLPLYPAAIESFDLS